MVWILSTAGPLLVVLLLFVNLFLRYDYLMMKFAPMTSWEIAMREIFFLMVFFFFPIGVTLLAAMIHFCEFQDDVWKQLLSMPVARSHIYLTKWFLLILLTGMSILVFLAGIWVTGLIFGFPEPFPILLYGEYGLYLFVSGLGISSIQHWLSSKCKNTMIPVAIGITGSVCALFLAQSEMTQYMPYASALAALPLLDTNQNIALISGLGFGIGGIALGMLEFQSKDMM